MSVKDMVPELNINTEDKSNCINNDKIEYRSRSCPMKNM